VAQLGLGSGLLGQLIFEPALERQMVGSELREVALQRRDRRLRARRAKLGSLSAARSIEWD
jgi:hypothetical protein